jgi:amino acid adenylation domain-containing protein
MSLRNFFEKLKERGIRLKLEEEGKVRVMGRRERLDEELLEELKENKGAIVEWLKQEGQQLRPAIVARVGEREEAPLSFAQRRLWFIDQMGGGSVQYNMPGAMRIVGKFEEEVAERAFRRIIERHQPLRTVIVNGEQGPVQRIRKEFEFRLGWKDLRDKGREEQELLVAEALEADAVQAFDLSRDLMLRAAFLRLSEEEGVLQFNMHHIAADGWSMGILVKEFGELYEAYAGGKQDPLPELSIQYADYAEWQREWLQGEVVERQLRYWEEQLADLPEVHGLVLDRVRPGVQSYEGGVETVEVEEELLRGLKQVGRGEQATLFMVLQGVFGLLLWRHGNGGDVVMGTAVANRLQKELEPLVGFFVNTLVLRVECKAGEKYREYVERVRAVNLEAQGHQDVPFEQVVERLKPRRSSSYGALFQIMFNMDQRAELHLPDMTVLPLQGPRVIAKFDLMLDALEDRGRLELRFTYNTALFEAATIARMGGRLKNLLRGVVANPEARIEELPLLSEAEREHLLYELNRTGVEYPRNLCVHELFEAQVQCTPDAVALAYEGEQLSYSELNQQANRLAHYLRSTHSVRPDTLVGLFLERSPQAVIGILGILKAGAGYVPLEPGYPQERLDYMLADSHPAVLLTQDSVAERVASSIIPRLRLDVDIDVLRRYSSDNPSRQAVGLETRHLAYVMYTSGSSGRPKGAMNEHAGVVNRLLWAQQAYGIGRGERILQKTSLSFDVSVWEVLLPLLSGGRVVVARAGGHMDPQYLVDLLEREQVTMVHFVPSMLQVFLEHVEHVEQGRRRVEHGGNEVEKERWWRYLRRVLCSGEALPYGVQQQFRTSLPGVELHNLYGPTEAAIDVTAWRCEEEAHGGVVPIGRPIANTQIYILDEQGELVGMGVTGEIYIGGAGVGRGYWERAEMTAERFVSEPFSGAEGGRMYRSGDVGRWLEDGTIEYLGRLDDQVKIRGFRIELGEIQKRLEQLEEVNKAIVITHPRGSSEQYIIAYVERTFKAGSHTELSNELWANGLRKALRAFLPDFMVPTIIVLDRLPLNPNGKVDIRRLKEFSGQPISPRTCVLPDTQTEIRIVEMWAGLLGVERENVPITARLFDLGGHSLLLIRLFNGIRAELNIELPFHTLFEVVTLRELAARIDAEAALQLMHRKMNSSAVLSEGYL